MDMSNRAERLKILTQTSADTPMGKLLRKFWHPVAISKDLKPGTAKPLRVLSEDLTLYRGESGRAYLVGGRCAHRLTVLHTGWIEGDNIRCLYHGWQYNGTGQCIHRPAEKDAGMPKVKIVGYPVHEYSGLIFAYLGEQPVPEFELPRKDVLDRKNNVVIARMQTWDFNWFQQVENSFDAVHVSFVHHYGRVGLFGAAVTNAIPELSYTETDAGILQTATRAQNNIRTNDWTFPNNNRLVLPGLEKGDPWIDLTLWMVPIDDEHTMRVEIYASPLTGEAAERLNRHFENYTRYNPVDHAHELFHDRKLPEEWIMELTAAQDYIVQKGQGTIADRLNEHLGRSDMGVVFLRKIFWRELTALEAGQPTKQWRRHRSIGELPRQPGLLAETR